MIARVKIQCCCDNFVYTYMYMYVILTLTLDLRDTFDLSSRVEKFNTFCNEKEARHSSPSFVSPCS